MNICAEVRYILTGDQNIITEHYFCYFRKEDINVDELYDNWEKDKSNYSFTNFIDKLFWKWYNNTNDYNRSYTFYRFIQDFKWQYDSKIKKVVDKGGIISIIKRDELFLFLENFVGLIKRFSKRVIHSFNEIVISEYMERQQRWGGNFLANLTQSQQLTSTSTVSYLNTSSTTNDINTNNLDMAVRIIGDNIIYNNQVYNRNDIGNGTFRLSSNHLGVIKKRLKPDYKKLKTERKRFRTVLKKSVSVLQRFIGLDKLLRFLNGEGFIIEAKRFNYRLSLPDHRSLIEGTKNINHFSIKYDLEILNKENEKICNVCTIFSGSPILDQVLSAYMFLVGGEEDALLKNCGFFSKSDDFYDHFPEEKSEDSYLFRQPELLRELNSAVTEVVGTTCNVQRNALPDLNRESINFARRSVNLERLRKKYRTKMDQELSYAIAEYLFTTDVSWGEAIDYAAFNLFNVKVFDKFVKDSKCQWQQERAAINNKIKKLGIFDATKSRKSKQSRNKFRQYLRGENTEWSDNISELLWRSYDRVGRKGLPGDRRKDSRTPSERTPVLYS